MQWRTDWHESVGLRNRATLERNWNSNWPNTSLLDHSIGHSWNGTSLLYTLRAASECYTQLVFEDIRGPARSDASRTSPLSGARRVRDPRRYSPPYCLRCSDRFRLCSSSTGSSRLPPALSRRRFAMARNDDKARSLQFCRTCLPKISYREA